MSNKLPRHPRSRTQEEQAAIGPDTVIGKIARASGEPARDVEAALVTAVSAGFDFDEVWEWMREALNDEEKIVDAVSRRLGSSN